MPSELEFLTVSKFNKDETRSNTSTRNDDYEDYVDVENTNEVDDSNNLLCIIHKNGKIGAAYYIFEDQLLNYYEEIIDLAPQFLCSINLFRQIRPKYLLTFGTIADDFVKALIDWFTTGVNITTTSDSIRSLPERFFLLPMKEYTYDICKFIISQLNLVKNNDEPSDVKREVYIHSCINFDHRLSIQAIGTIIKFLEKNWTIFNIDKIDLQHMQVQQVSRKDHVLVDYSTFEGSLIFSSRSHDSSFKRGLPSTCREGLSVYKLFSTYCKSRIGLAALRSVLVNPIKNINILSKRLEFIDFVLHPHNKEYVESLQDNIRQVGYDLNKILRRIENFRATSKDWYVLYKTISHTIFINDISGPYRGKLKLLEELNETVSTDLVSLEHSIASGLDFANGQKKGRPIIRFGLDQTLDEKKLRQQDISKDVTAAARFAANNLPDFLNECAIVYLPEMGHLIAINEWEPNCDPELLQDLGFQFMFTLKGTIHYKNPLCVEMDKRLGDINAEIIDHENRILRRLSGFILKYSRNIYEPLKVIGLLDCLISMATVASQHSYTRPHLNSDSVIEIRESRHLLMEHLVTQFQPNDFQSGGGHSHVKIITGPNGSGKSMYLKQIALIIFLAHIGSYVPAEYANIALIDSMHSRMQATESACVRLSAFMIDVTQITQTFCNPLPSSIILLDEFGRGTSEEDSISLLAGLLKNFVERGRSCPHILVSTHFQQISSHLPASNLVQYLKMDHTKEGGVLCFLYKLVDGTSLSFGFDIAESVGLDQDILARAREILGCLRNNQPIVPLQTLRNKFDTVNLAQLNVPQPDEEN